MNWGITLVPKTCQSSQGTKLAKVLVTIFLCEINVKCHPACSCCCRCTAKQFFQNAPQYSCPSWPLPEIYHQANSCPQVLTLGSCCLVAKLCPTLVTPRTIARQVPFFMEHSRQEYWSRLPFPSPGDLPDPRPGPKSPALAGRVWH